MDAFTWLPWGLRLVFVLPVGCFGFSCIDPAIFFFLIDGVLC
jgi:hypothetical protein